MTLRQVRTIKDGDVTFEVWSNSDASNWEIRKPEPSQGDPAYSAYGILGSGGQGLDLTSPRVVVRDNIYVNNYNNSDLSLSVKNQVLNDLKSGFGGSVNEGFDGNAGIGTSTEEDKGKPEASFEFPEFGKVDKILQQLSLRNLKYPLDADYGNTQDYIQINQFSYKSPTEGYFFPKASGTFGVTKGPNKYKGARRVGFDKALETAGLGVRTGTPKEKAIGLVKLPMPNSLADSNNVSWGPDQLNAITAAATSAVMGTSNSALDGLMKFLANPKNTEDGIAGLLSKGLAGAGQFIQETGADLSGAIKDIPGGGLNAAMNNKNINLLGKTVLGSTLLNLIGFQVSPESILARGAGVVPNNNLALLFNSPTLREFTFSWKMSPRSREEATRVNNILRFFKQGMAAKKSNNSRGSGGSSYFLGTPNVFDIHFKTAKIKDYEILDRNDSVLRIKTCACTGAAVNYTPEGMWNAYEKGQPVAITLTLRFNELEPIFDTDYDNNYFNFDPQRTDLLPVPTDAVGY